MIRLEKVIEEYRQIKEQRQLYPPLGLVDFEDIELPEGVATEEEYNNFHKALKQRKIQLEEQHEALWEELKGSMTIEEKKKYMWL